jgi:hypothetical protein
MVALLNQALVREFTVSRQYRLQHAVSLARDGAPRGISPAERRAASAGSDSRKFLPRPVTVKKIAIAEMRHAEAIVERMAALGGIPATHSDAFTLGESAGAMIATDVEPESGAMALYTEIVARATELGDESPALLFERIWKEERAHHGAFSAMIQAGR